MSPIADAIGDFKTGTFLVTRSVASSYTNGRAVQGVQTTFYIDATVVPAGGQELLRLEEGDRSKESRVVITTGTLRSEGHGFEPDVVTIGADTWQVAAVEDWTQFGFIKAICVKRGRA